MVYSLILYIIVAAVFTLAGYFMWIGSKNTKASMGIRFKRNRFKDLRTTIKEQLSDAETDNIFEGAGINLSSSLYQIIRYAVFTVWLVGLLYNKINFGDFSRYSLALLLAVFAATSPRKELFGQKSPFLRIIDLFKNKFRIRKNKELYTAISLLKSLSIVSSVETLGSDYILEELMKFTRITKPIFSKFLSMWYEADKAAACEYFANAIGTKEGRELSNIFMKLDDLNPSELKHQIELFQNMVNTERQTQKEKSNETRGTILYAMVMFSAIVVLLNFVIVVITIDALSFYKSIFN